MPISRLPEIFSRKKTCHDPTLLLTSANLGKRFTTMQNHPSFRINIHLVN